MVAFHINHLHKVIEGVQGGGSRDVIDEEESVGFEIRRSPEAAIFFLTGRVGEGEEVGLAIYGACGGVGVLWRVESGTGCGTEGDESTYRGVVSVEKTGLAVHIRLKGQWLTHASIDFVPVVALSKTCLKGRVSGQRPC